MPVVENVDRYIGCLEHLAVKPGSFEQRANPLPEEEKYLPGFLRDRLAIQDSKASRRLEEKTQVFTVHPNPHIRHRSSHVAEVVTTAARMACLTGLNRDLCEAIAFGHDIGHTPFGHLGETVISDITGQDFRHEVFGTIVAQKIERQGKGLNLTRGTLLGMRWHSGWYEMPAGLDIPLEAKAVMMADKIAYTFADVNDVARLKFGDPTTMIRKAQEFGNNQRERVTTCLHAILKESADKGSLSFHQSDIAQAFLALRKWMYQSVYQQFDSKRKYQDAMLRTTHEFISEHPFFVDCNPTITLALMTDREVERLVSTLNNDGDITESELAHYSFSEIIPHIRGREFDLTTPALV